MADSALYRGEIHLHVNPDTGLILLRLGSLSLAGFCRAGVNVAGQPKVTVTGMRAVELAHDLIDDAHGKGQRLVVRFADGPHDVGLRLEVVVYESRPFVTLRLGVLNHGVSRVFVQTITPLDAIQINWGEGPLDGWVNGFHSWSFTGFVPHNCRQPRPAFGFLTRPQAANPTTPMPRRPGQYVGEWVGMLLDEGGQALVAGFIGVEDQFGQVYLDGRPGHRRLMLQNTADGVPLGSGEVMWGEWAVLYPLRLPHPDPLGEYAEAVARLSRGRLPAPYPSPGWSSWYQFFDRVTLDDLLRNQVALTKLRRQLPLTVVQLDDGYQPAWGDWLAHNDRFPSSVGGWAAGVRDSGFQPGLWLSPFTVEPSSSVFRSYPEAVLRTAGGRPVSGGVQLRRQLYGLDPTHPATQYLLHKVFETAIKEWGIRYLKLDFLYCGALPGARHDPSRTRAQALRDGLKLIRDIAGEDVTMVGCGCPLGPAIGLVDIMRVGPDVAPYWYPQLLGIRALFRESFSLPSARNSLAVSLNRHWTHRRFWWLDADNLIVRKQQSLTDAEVQTLVTVLAMADSHLVLSDDLPTLEPERIQWAASLLPYLPGRTEIPTFPCQTAPDMLIRRYAGPAGPHLALALINWQDVPARLSASRDVLGLPEQIPLLAFDFWSRRASVLPPGPIESAPVPPHGVVLLHLRPLVPGPQLVGTDLHISGGQEVVHWDVRRDSLHFDIQLERCADGAVWLKLPAPPHRAECGGKPAEIVATDQPGIYAVRVSVDGVAEVIIYSEG